MSSSINLSCIQVQHRDCMYMTVCIPCGIHALPLWLDFISLSHTLLYPTSVTQLYPSLMHLLYPTSVTQLCQSLTHFAVPYQCDSTLSISHALAVPYQCDSTLSVSHALAVPYQCDSTWSVSHVLAVPYQCDSTWSVSCTLAAHTLSLWLKKQTHTQTSTQLTCIGRGKLLSELTHIAS